MSVTFTDAGVRFYRMPAGLSINYMSTPLSSLPHFTTASAKLPASTSAPTALPLLHRRNTPRVASPSLLRSPAPFSGVQELRTEPSREAWKNVGVQCLPQVFERSTQATSTRSLTALTMEDLKSVEIQSAKGVLSSARDTYDRVIREVHKQKTIEGISRSIEERMVQE